MISVKHLSKKFDSLSVINDISFDISKGDVFGIIGHSGAGKSTLLRCFNGLEKYVDGSIKIMDKEVKELSHDDLKLLRKDLGMIFQNFNLMNRLNVYENIALPLKFWGYDKETIDKRVKELIKLVGIESKLFEKVKNLSGGQKQRVGIARALSLNPKVLLCDEATSALDPKTTKSILQLLMDINKKLNITIIIVTHQMEVVKEICNKMILLEDGEIKASGNVEELFLTPNNSLKILLGEDEILPENGVNIKILFPKGVSNESLIYSMSRNVNVEFSIAWGKLERFREDVLGSLIINVKNGEEGKIIEYLNSKNVRWEEV